MKKRKNSSTLLGNWKNCDVYTNCNWCFWYSHQRIYKGTGWLGNMKTSGDHPKYWIIEIGQNTEKGPGDLRRLAVTQTPVKDHQITLMWKTLKMIITIFIIARMVKTQQNSKYRLCGDRDETINHIISECSKLAQKKLDTTGCWRGSTRNCPIVFQFDHTNKCYIDISESVRENETQKVLWDLEIQKNHLNSARRPHLVIMNKKLKKKKRRACLTVEFAVPTD